MVSNGALVTTRDLTFRIQGLPAEAVVAVDISRFLPDARILLGRSSAGIQIGTQLPNVPMAVRNITFSPQRVEFEVTEAPETMTVRLSVSCAHPFIYGWLHVPDSAITTIVGPQETLRLAGPGYWAQPLAQAVTSYPGVPDNGHQLVTLPHLPEKVLAAPPAGGSRGASSEFDKASKHKSAD